MDPLEHVLRWSRWTATGPESVISNVFDVLDAKLPKGWKRLTGDDLLPYQFLDKPGSAWYDLDTSPSCIGFVLSIERTRETELMGGRVWFKGPPSPPGEANARVVWEQVSRFLDETIIPAALETGANIRVPTPEEIFLSDLPFDIQDRLQRFSDAARKSLPLNREEAELWHGFVIAAFQSRPVIEDKAFINWLAKAGWPRDSAAELSAQFFDLCLFLSRYADEVSAA